MDHANDGAYAEAVPVLLRSLERQIDQTFALLADLGAALPRARMEARLSGVVGQSVFKQVASASTSLVEVRGHVVNVHNLLDGIAKRYGIEYAAGDEVPKAPMPFTTGQVSSIGAVG